MGRKNWVCQVTRITGAILLFPFFRLMTHGSENLPQDSAFVLLPKHQRWEDIPLLGMASPRPLYYVAKHELFSNPFSNWLMDSLGGIPLNRKNPLKSRHSFARVLECLKAGEGVVVFPEGTYRKDRMGRARSGMIKLILSRMTLPFVPVGICYSKQGLRSIARINFGNPVHAGPRSSVSDFIECMMKDIEQLSGLA